MQKIAIVIPKYGLIGGAEQFAAELTDRLISATGFDFYLYANRCEKSANPITFKKIPIINFPKFLTTPSFAYFTKCRIKNKNFSIVHSHERVFNADIFTMHGIPHRYWVKHIRQKKMSLYDLATIEVEKKFIYEGNCKKFIAVSNLTRDIFLQEYNIDPDLVDVIHPGVDLNDYLRHDNNSARHNIRNELRINDIDPVILFASMNFEIKGLDNIMFSLAKLKAKKLKFKFIVAGKGNIKKYKRLASEINIIEDVIFTGPVNKEKIIKMYLASDFYIMLSKFDTFGMVVLEAMAAGLPVIISSNVGAKDLVHEGQNGFIINDINNHDYIAAKIALLCDKNIRKPLAERAYETATQNTWDQVVSSYKEIYLSILENCERDH